MNLLVLPLYLYTFRGSSLNFREVTSVVLQYYKKIVCMVIWVIQYGAK